jgi:hypothetical protein
MAVFTIGEVGVGGTRNRKKSGKTGKSMPRFEYAELPTLVMV